MRLPRPARPRAQTRPARAALCLVPPARPALARCPCRGGQLPRVRTRAWWWSSLGASANYSSGRPPGSRLPARLSLSSLGCCPHPCAVHVQASRVCVCVCVCESRVSRGHRGLSRPFSGASRLVPDVSRGAEEPQFTSLICFMGRALSKCPSPPGPYFPAFSSISGTVAPFWMVCQFLSEEV